MTDDIDPEIGGSDTEDHLAGDAEITDDDAEIDTDEAEMDFEHDTIADHVERVEEIIDRLESGEPSLVEAERLREEGRARLSRLRDDLDVGSGELLELD